MKNFLIGLMVGSVTVTSVMLWVSDDQPVITPICENTPALVETKVIEKECPIPQSEIDNTKIEKAFLLFLASIGIKNSLKYQEQVKNIVTSPDSFRASPSPVETEPTPSLVETQFFYDQGSALKKMNTSEMWREISDYDRGLKRLSNSLLKEPAVYFARSKTVEQVKLLMRLKGTYIGKFYRLVGKNKGKVEDVEMNVDFWLKDKKIDGTFNMTIARDGTVWSNMRGSGENDNIYVHPQNPKQIIIKAAPGMYFQFENERLLQANVYDEGEFIGVSTLTRQ